VVSLKAGAAEVSPMAEAEVSCAPNPFNSETTFTLRVNQTALVSLTIRDINGQTVATLLNSRMPDGLYQATWDGTGSNGAIAGNGVYCYHLIIDGKQRDSGKIVLIR
jgi:flagellar hook assembly protein FlgD